MPLNESRIKVKNPNFLPRILVAFVAPIFFEPDSRMSTLAKILPNTRPKGIEATKYVMIKNKN